MKLKTERRKLILHFFCASAFLLGFFMLWWLLDVDLRKPALAQRTDFLNCFYVAGIIASRGSLHELYPPLTADSQVGFDFARVAHSLLPYLPASSQPCWQYPPIDAQFLSLFAGLPSSTALLAWQIVSMCALSAIVYFLSHSAKVHWCIVLSLFIFFFPFFQTLKFGQQGIVLGLFPICAAFYLLHHKKPFIAGLIASLTLLTLKFLVLAGLISLVLVRIERRMLIGLITGCSLLLGFMLVSIPVETCLQWLHNIHLSEKYFFEPHFVHNLSLYISLPALLILHFPIEFRTLGKVLFYILAFVILVITMLIQWRSTNSTSTLEQKLRIVFALGFYLMPMVLPHLLYYDLAGIMVANILIWEISAPYIVIQKLRAIAMTSTLVIDAYFIGFAVLNSNAFSPLMFTLILSVIYSQLLIAICQIPQKGEFQQR